MNRGDISAAFSAASPPFTPPGPSSALCAPAGPEAAVLRPAPQVRSPAPRRASRSGPADLPGPRGPHARLRGAEEAPGPSRPEARTGAGRRNPGTETLSGPLKVKVALLQKQNKTKAP